MENEKHIDKEVMVEIVKEFKGRCESLGIKQDTKKFYSEQTSYFVGVLITLTKLGYTVPPAIPLLISSSRNMIKSYLND